MDSDHCLLYRWISTILDYLVNHIQVCEYLHLKQAMRTSHIKDASTTCRQCEISAIKSFAVTSWLLNRVWAFVTSAASHSREFR